MKTTKLTLSVPEDIVSDAKAYARAAHQSLSSLVSHYLSVLAKNKKSHRGTISQTARQLTGIAKSEKSYDELRYEAMKEKYKL